MSPATRSEVLPATPSTTTAAVPFWRTAVFWYLLAALNAVVVAGFWYTSSGHLVVRSSADFFNGLGRVTGLEGTYLVLLQLALMSRLGWFEEAIGLERLAVLHRFNGYLAIGLLLAHAVFQTIGYMLGDGYSVLGQLGDFIANYEGLLAAIVGLLLMLTVVGISIGAARIRFSYETWYFIHLYSYVAVLLAFSHQLATGIDFVRNPIFTDYWIGLYLLLIAVLAWFRIARPLLLFSRHRFWVHRVVKEGPGIHSIYIRGRDLAGFRVAPGQFLIWRFLDEKRWWQAHPFSLSLPADGREMRLTVKNIGDYTARLGGLRPGTPVLIEGPFGKFTEERATNPRVLLIAGGIGITPLRALAESMAARGHDVVLLYRATRQRDVVFKEELDKLAASGRIQVEYLLSEGPRQLRNRAAWFKSKTMRELVPDIADREVYICGPVGMTETVTALLPEVGVDAARIHTEVFRY
ncbi:MAG TPA: ferredoxin reductase family protein [Candidatus Dormibacteraeota bacterium]|nr:ferredoxin reductase family protein [Candidatus Dormibacteraeota bacterium]